MPNPNIPKDNKGFPTTKIGGKTFAVDNEGWPHTTVGNAIDSNQRDEGGRSRGTSGGCTQDSDKLRK